MCKLTHGWKICGNSLFFFWDACVKVSCVCVDAVTSDVYAIEKQNSLWCILSAMTLVLLHNENWSRAGVQCETLGLPDHPFFLNRWRWSSCNVLQSNCSILSCSKPRQTDLPLKSSRFLHAMSLSTPSPLPPSPLPLPPSPPSPFLPRTQQLN